MSHRCTVTIDAAVYERLKTFAHGRTLTMSGSTACDNEITINHSVTAAQVDAIARAAGWKTSGRNHHWCPACKDADSKGCP